MKRFGSATFVVAAFMIPVCLLFAIVWLATHPTVKIERVVVIETTTTLPANLSLPRGATYAQVKAAVLESIRNWYAQSGASYPGISPYTHLDCVLPPRWNPGAQFACVTFGNNGLQNGTANVTIETTNPGQPFSISIGFRPS